MTELTPTVYLPIESRARELDACLFLTRKLPERGLTARRGNTRISFLLAPMLWVMDRRDRATEHFKQAVTLDPAREMDVKIILLTTPSVDFTCHD
jgi:hypothetical protein